MEVRWHAATCDHKWCCCFNPASHQEDGDCQHCRRKKRGVEMREQYRRDQEKVKGADPTIRHPEGM